VITAFDKRALTRRALLKTGLLGGFGLAACTSKSVAPLAAPVSSLHSDRTAALDQGFAALPERHSIGLSPGATAALSRPGMING
jgi:hypothetical protein